MLNKKETMSFFFYLRDIYIVLVYILCKIVWNEFEIFIILCF